MPSAITIARQSNHATLAKPVKRRRPRPLLLTTAEIARRLRIHPRTVALLVEQGVLPCLKFGRKLRRYHLATVEQHLARLSLQSVAPLVAEGPDGGLIERGEVNR